MIAFLTGTVIEKTDNFIILNVNGVGYQIFSYNNILISAKKDSSLEVFVFHVIKENEESLYGFNSLDERSFFELLISVSGVGPKTAMEFFNLPMDNIKDAISSWDVSFITSIKGIGKKTAERIILELKNKLWSIRILENIVVSSDNNASQDVLLALESLGFEKISIVQSLKNAPQFENTEEAVMWFLKNN